MQCLAHVSWIISSTLEWRAPYLLEASSNLLFTKVPVAKRSGPGNPPAADAAAFSASSTFCPDMVTKRKSPLWEITSSEKLLCRRSIGWRDSRLPSPSCIFSSSCSACSNQTSNSMWSRRNFCSSSRSVCACFSCISDWDKAAAYWSFSSSNLPCSLSFSSGARLCSCFSRKAWDDCVARMTFCCWERSSWWWTLKKKNRYINSIITLFQAE